MTSSHQIVDAAEAGAKSFTGISRRGFLAGLGAFGAGALLPGCASTGVASGKPYRIDVHHHFVAPTYSAALKARGQGHIGWSVQKSLEDMDKSGIATSLTSLIQPAMAIGEVEANRRLSREANEYAAKLARDYPGRFGSYATIPFTDTAGALKEIEYALDTLKAEGFCLMTSYNGKYLGDPAFFPVLEELNRRNAIVYVHPLAPQCCAAILPDVNVGTIEYAVDSTRTMASLVFGGGAARYPNIRWIFSHSGGTTPFLWSRFIRQEQDMKGEAIKRMPNGAIYEYKKFFYETAQGNHPGALDALMRVIPLSQVLYGTDFPYRDGAEVNEGLANYRFNASERMAIERDNALRMMPRLKA
jgi:predicted TIM-barrel fold metal-dependent hydrolase